MADQSVINNVYNYYLTTYAPKSDTKYDTHKKSELRGVYDSMVKLNKEAPLYIVDRTSETREYAIGLKENARSFRNVLASLGGLEAGELLNKKVAFSSDESVLAAQYVGAYDETPVLPGFDVDVIELASPQVNQGEMLNSSEKALPDGAFSFDININGVDYEFQYKVVPGDTNRSLQDKLARLITNANIGLKSEVVSDGEGKSALRIESVSTGAIKTGEPVFTLSEDNSSMQGGSVKAFGLDRMVVAPKDSTVRIDDEIINTSTNSFTVNREYEISLNATSNGETVKVGLRADSESLVENIGTLIDAYNGYIDTVEAYTDKHPHSGRLAGELKELARVYMEPLANMGITADETGRLQIDAEPLKNSLSVKEGNENLEGLRKFAGSVLRKSNQVSLNPMQYVDKRVVSYKNPGKNYATPYTTSAYSGMMFNGYC